jgi:hypothetical protein
LYIRGCPFAVQRSTYDHVWSRQLSVCDFAKSKAWRAAFDIDEARSNVGSFPFFTSASDGIDVPWSPWCWSCLFMGYWCRNINRTDHPGTDSSIRHSLLGDVKCVLCCQSAYFHKLLLGPSPDVDAIVIQISCEHRPCFYVVSVVTCQSAQAQV